MFVNSLIARIILLFILTCPDPVFCQLLEYNTHISIDKQNRKKTEKRFLIQVNNREEAWLSNIEIQHKRDEDFNLIEASIINKEGDIVRKLKKKEVKTRSSISDGTFHQDMLIEEFNLVWNDYPYQIVYKYSIEQPDFLFLAWWTPLFYKYIMTMSSELSVTVPLDYPINIDQSEGLNYKIKEDERQINYIWKSIATEAPKEEIFSPPIEELIPTVAITPINFKYGVEGSHHSWATFGLWLDELNSGTEELTQPEKFEIGRLTRGLSSEVEIIKTLYHYLQDKTTYVNVTLAEGGLKSYPASYVCENKYGDCKALTTYMKAMLNHAGISSVYTIVSAGRNEPRVNTIFPGQQFNHVILMVPLDRDTIWLENTSNTAPFNYVGTNTQNRWALAVDGDDSQLIRTPKLQIEDVAELRKITLDVNFTKSCSLNILLNFKGMLYENLRYSYSNNNPEEFSTQLVDLLDMDGFELETWDLTNFHRDSTFIELQLSGKHTKGIRNIGSFKVIKPLAINVPSFESPESRIYPVRINLPIHRMDSIQIQLPENHTIEKPNDLVIESDFGYYAASYVHNQSTIQVREEFILSAGDYALESYPDIFGFIEKIKKYKKKSAIILK